MANIASAHAVIAGIDLNGLGVLRSLGAAGVPLAALDTDITKPTCATRFGRKRQVRALEGDAFIEDLLALRGEFSAPPVLLLTQEASVATVSAQRARLEGAYRFTMPEHGLMEQLLHKLGFQALAERTGAPIPRAIRLSAESEGDVSQLRFPCVLKPVTKDLEYGKKFKKAYKLSSADEVAPLWQAMRGVVSEVIVQEWIEGGDSDVYFCLQYRPRTGPITSFAGRKIRQWPRLVGGTACCIPAPEHAAELTELTDAFFGAVGFVGIGSMEYKRDRRDGRFLMVEPTVGRTDFQEEIATLNGVNIPLALWRGEQGLPPPPSQTLPAIGWRDPIGDHHALAAGAALGEAPAATEIKFRDAYFRANDPGPVLRMKLDAVRRRLGLRRAG